MSSNYPNEKNRPLQKKQPWYSRVSIMWWFIAIMIVAVAMYYGIEAVVR